MPSGLRRRCRSVPTVPSINSPSTLPFLPSGVQPWGAARPRSGRAVSLDLTKQHYPE